MIQVAFRNLEPSELAKAAAIDRLQPLLRRYQGLRAEEIGVVLEMHHTPVHAGPDFFTARAEIKIGLYSGLSAKKTARSLLVALDEVVRELSKKLQNARGAGASTDRD